MVQDAALDMVQGPSPHMVQDVRRFSKRFRWRLLWLSVPRAAPKTPCRRRGMVRRYEGMQEVVELIGRGTGRHGEEGGAYATAESAGHSRPLPLVLRQGKGGGRAARKWRLPQGQHARHRTAEKLPSPFHRSTEACWCTCTRTTRPCASCPPRPRS